MKHLLPSIPPDFQLENQPHPCSPQSLAIENVLKQGILLGKMATAAMPILTILLMVQPAKAWEKSATLEEFEASDHPVPKLTINSQVTHTIQEGDTLWELSRRYDISPQEIATYNDISVETLLQVGETLEIPTNQEQPQLVKSSFGGVGGAVPSDDLMIVQTLNDNETVTAVPNLIAQDLTASNLPSENSQAPVQDFLADVKQLQSQYQQKHLELDRFEPQDKTTDFSPADSSSGSLEINPESLASAPIKIEFYNRFLNSPIGETVSPELPPLSSPDQYLPKPGQQFNGYIWPAEGIFTSGYGRRWGRMHRGIDIAGPIGTPILAAAPGEVIFAGWNNGGYGKLVKLQHPDESVTLYAHNNRILVQNGQEVDQGEPIAEMGNTGRSTGPHLHFELHPREQGAVNPLAHLPSGEQVRKGQKITDEKMNPDYTSRR